VCGRDWDLFLLYAGSHAIPTHGNGALAAFYTFIHDPSNAAHVCGFTLLAQRMDEVQYRRYSWRSTPLSKLIDKLGLADLYDGGEAQKRAIEEELALNSTKKRDTKSGNIVCCPTVFRAHKCPSSCLPVNMPKVAPVGVTPIEPSEAAAESSATGGGDDESSVTSAAALALKPPKKQRTHAPSSAWLAHTISTMQAERGLDASTMGEKDVRSPVLSNATLVL
jgi:hypothetical protein